MEKCLAYDIYKSYGIIKMINPKRKTFMEKMAYQFYKEFNKFEQSYLNDYEDMFNFGDWYILETYSGGVLELVAKIVGNMIAQKPVLLSLNNKSIKRLYEFYNALQYISFEEALSQYYQKFTIPDNAAEEKTVSGIKLIFLNCKEIITIKLNMLLKKLQRERIYYYYD